MNISNEAQQKIEAIKKAGKDKLHIVSDFDRTLTPDKVNGEKSSTSFAQFRNGGYLGEEYIKSAHELFEKYRPIEVDVNISDAEKRDHMKEWWRLHMGLLVEHGVSMEIINEIIEKGRVSLREGGQEFFAILHENDIPVLIMSAGVGDLISTFLQKENLLTDNVHLISNFFEFDRDGRAIGIKGQTISVANKDESEVAQAPYASEVAHRRNVILLGDSPNDLHMLEGLGHDAVLKIGFLNEANPQNRAEFEQAFDILIENDGSLEPVNSLLREVISGE